MKILTSVTLHTTSEGQRLSYTYSIVNAETGAIVSDNHRESTIVMDLPQNAAVLEHIAGIKAFAAQRLANET